MLPSLARAAASDRLNIAAVGVGGKGASDIANTSVGQNVVAICDVDERTLGQAAEKISRCQDLHRWRKMLDAWARASTP